MAIMRITRHMNRVMRIYYVLWETTFLLGPQMAEISLHNEAPVHGKEYSDYAHSLRY